MTNFSDFGLDGPIMTALEQEGHKTPTSIQAGAIPSLLTGHDVLGIAQTGSGKTAAFALPALQKLALSPRKPNARTCRVLVLTPTRELAAQVQERFSVYGKHLRARAGLVIGGAPMGRQRAMLQRGIDIVVATPGRLLDHIDQGNVTLDAVEMFVLDEVDQMLDLGFFPAIRLIAGKLPKARQNVFFSATMPPKIAKLAAGLLSDPVRVEIAASERPKIDQSVMFLNQGEKPRALLSVIRRDEFSRGLVFTRTKHGADKVVKTLNAEGIDAFAIHGNRSQGQRERALKAFRTGNVNVLVATDIAARGIDITAVSHVVNYDLPNVPETYVHRIGRTARAGASGVAVSFCAGDDRQHLRSIEKLTCEKIFAIGEDNQPKSTRDQKRGGGSSKGKFHGKPGGKTSEKPGANRRKPRVRRRRGAGGAGQEQARKAS